MNCFYYAIYDDKAEEFGPLFPAKNDKVALRHFRQMMSSVNNQDDYSLFCVGCFDQDSGQFGLPFEKYEVAITEDVE